MMTDENSCYSLVRLNRDTCGHITERINKLEVARSETMAACGSGDANGDGAVGADKNNLDLSELLNAMDGSSENVTDDEGLALDSGVDTEVDAGAVGGAGGVDGGENVDTDQKPSIRMLTLQNAQQLIHKAVGILQQANEKEKSGAATESFTLCKQGIDLLMVAYKVPGHSERMKGQLYTRIASFLSQAEHLRDHVIRKQSSDTCKLCKSSSQKEGETHQTNDYLEGFLMRSNDKWSLNAVVGHTEARQSLMENLVLPFKFPQLFTGVRQPRRVVLLFGHPGTGKTMLLSAIASELPDCTFIRVSVFDFMSKYMGDCEKYACEKNVREVFNYASERTPCVLCIEDIERISCPVPAHGDMEHSWRQTKTELLVQLQQVFSYQRTKQMMVVFMSQRPWCMCASVRRRAEGRIFTDLPTKEDRVNILKSNMVTVAHNLTNEDFNQLGDRTLSLGGYRCTQADLTTICRDAMMQPVRRIQEAKYFKQVAHPKTKEEGFWTPCCQGDEGAVEMNWMELDANKFLEPEIEMSDFLQCLEKCRGTVDPEEEYRMQEWVENFTSLREGR